jgi:hypothetical protein
MKSSFLGLWLVSSYFLIAGCIYLIGGLYLTTAASSQLIKALENREADRNIAMNVLVDAQSRCINVCTNKEDTPQPIKNKEGSVFLERVVRAVCCYRCFDEIKKVGVSRFIDAY